MSLILATRIYYNRCLRFTKIHHFLYNRGGDKNNVKE